MSIMTEAEARKIVERVIELSTADECTATLTGTVDGNVRFALNNVSTAGLVSNCQLGVQVAYGKRTGVATINSFDEDSLKRVVERAEELAKLAPENPEFMPALDKQDYKATPTYSEATAKVTAEFRAQVAADSIEACKKESLIAAGFFNETDGFFCIANSKGNFAYQRTSNVDYTCTVRTEDGSGSGWVGRNVQDVGDFDVKEAIKVGIDKSKGSVGAKALEPGKYTVILEPHAAAGLISFMMFGFDARQADEGRSFLAKKGGGTKLGEQVFDQRVNMYADPWHPEAPVVPWDQEGRPREKLTIIDKGKVNYLQYSRYWAKQKDKEGSALPGNIIMAGGDKSTMELVKGTKKGILVTRTWYIRLVDPQTMLLTGLTRDGTFYIEDGEIKYPIKNFRFNESPVIMLNNVEELGKPIRLSGDESPFVMLMPPMKLRDFTFTSLSDAV